MKKLCGNPTKPAAGVIATNPTTAPMQKPSAEGFLPRIASKNIQERPAAAEAVFVVAKAVTARLFAAKCRTCIKTKPSKP